MRILGIDPGTHSMGYGVIEDAGRGMRLVRAGALRAGRGLPLAERLLAIGDLLREVLADARPQAIAIEKAFHGRNVKALIAMGEGRGVALYCAGQCGASIHEYAPTEIKKALTGRGGARKEQVADMVRAMLGEEKIEGGLDATDALAVALCHAQRRHLAASRSGAEGILARLSRGRVRRGRGR
ncbi:MAG: crossover junction endodeoxyribonuclease RuvC [Planctomycetes bacterium]|nr:crossover junction endodeoxyribonuclease RuvC [Planctomycetota bacterium]